MAQRTSFEEQIKALNRCKNVPSGYIPALKDATVSLMRLKAIRDALYQEEPDDEQVTELLMGLLVGS